jgi:hypothetical protein
MYPTFIMELKLIQAGGFTGKHKVATEDLATYPEAIKQHVHQAFYEAKEKQHNASHVRDKEHFFLEYDGIKVPIATFKADVKLDQIIKKLKANLQYQK